MVLTMNIHLDTWFDGFLITWISIYDNFQINKIMMRLIEAIIHSTIRYSSLIQTILYKLRTMFIIFIIRWFMKLVSEFVLLYCVWHSHYGLLSSVPLMNIHCVLTEHSPCAIRNVRYLRVMKKKMESSWKMSLKHTITSI